MKFKQLQTLSAQDREKKLIEAKKELLKLNGQVVTGTALNILVFGLSAFLFRVIFGTPLFPLKVKPLQSYAIPLLSDIPILGPILFDQNILTYLLVFIVPASFYFLYKTSYGLIIRSTGENRCRCEICCSSRSRAYAGTHECSSCRGQYLL